MHHGRGAQQSDGASDQSRQHGRAARRKHHGLCTAGEHHALRYVYVAGESRSRCRHHRGHGSADPDALHPRDNRTMDPGRSHGVVGWKSDTRQHIGTDVHVGWCDSNCQSR